MVAFETPEEAMHLWEAAGAENRPGGEADRPGGEAEKPWEWNQKIQKT